MIDFIGWIILALGVGFAAGILAAYWRGFHVFKRQLHDHHEALREFYGPTLEENERLKTEVMSIGAINERLMREVGFHEQALADYVDEITGLHHALDAQAEANRMIDEEEELHATAPRKVTRIRASRRAQQQEG